MRAFFLTGLMLVSTSFFNICHANEFQIRADEWNDSPYVVARDYHRVFRAKINKFWHPPKTAKGAYVRVKFHINADGTVKSTRIETISDELRISMQSAINSAAPYPLPENKEQRRLTRRFEGTFFVR